MFRRANILKIVSFCILYFAFCIPHILAQEYTPPMSGELLFSSSYGELRAANIHTGVDIKTGSRVGLPVYAALDGYIARIGIKPYGYGRVLYIAHTNGMTTVYGHLDRFMPKVEEYVRSKRYETEQSTIDLWLMPGEFGVKRGEQIAFSGNSGRSSGPHLHYELRETPTQRLYNPVLHDIVKVADTRPPTLRNLYYYEVDTLAGVPIHRRTHSFALKDGGKGRYSVSAPVRLSRKGYFVVETIDHKDKTTNVMGVAQVMMRVDERIRFIYQTDGITFSDTPFGNTIAPYDLRTSGHYSSIRMARYAGLKLPFYALAGSTGVIDPEKDRSVEFDVEDDCGNHSTFSFMINYSPAEPPVLIRPEYSEVVTPSKECSFSTGALRVTIPVGALHESAFYSQIELEQKTTSPQKRYSEFYRIGEATAPLRKSYRIYIEVVAPEEVQPHLVLARLNANGRLSAAGGRYSDGAVGGSASSFGTFCVVADTVPPTIRPLFADGIDATKLGSLAFTISDDFSGVASFEVEVDGKWAILEHDSMRGRVVYEFDDKRIGKDKTHTIRLTITDGARNKTTTNITFKR